MTIPHHALIDEFPEYRERINQLIAENGHFARLRDTYALEQNNSSKYWRVW